LRHTPSTVIVLPNPTLTFIILGLGVLIFVLILLLPALFELKMPKDAGPRMIRDPSSPINLAMREIPVENIEEKLEFNQILMKNIVDAISVLPNLEV
jgi:hypothetical protein